jgi:hypothetical protein
MDALSSSRPRNNNMGIFYNKTYEFISTVKFKKKLAIKYLDLDPH